MLEKRRKRDEKEFESDLASAMIVNAQKRSNMLREKTMAMQGAQKDSVRFGQFFFALFSEFILPPALRGNCVRIFYLGQICNTRKKSR